MELSAFYAAVGGSYEEVTSRFQTDERTRKFLGMFAKDQSFDQLTAAVEAGDAQTAFRAVHTLKGIALNLALGDLAEACSQMTEALRGKDTLPESGYYEKVKAAYETALAALKELGA